MNAIAAPRQAPLPLAALFARLQPLGARLTGSAASVVLRDVRHDSREVGPGALFVARRGGRADGAAHVAEAVARGAVALLVAEGAEIPDLGVPVLRAEEPGRLLGHAAEAVFGDPSRALDVIGITGTNGKTTTSFLVEAALASRRVARLGTLGYHFEGDAGPPGLTTPEADEVSRLLARARDAGAGGLVMEVSSHALAQGRVDALRFRAAAFTNLSQDHLDFHGTMEAYGEAKARLFDALAPEASVLNLDDAFGARLVGRARGRVLGVSRALPAGPDRVSGAKVRLDRAGIAGPVDLPSGRVRLESRLLGAHNLENLLVVLGVAEVLGADVREAAQALARAPGVPGRLERVDEAGDDVLVLVDYAHTPDALARVLEAVRRLGTGRIVCVFGCGGDRDPEKRPLMGEAVGRLADRAIVTSDNPRSEDPASIVAAVVPGLLAHTVSWSVELDRARAIEAAILEAAPGDVVVVAGKGHEPYQIVGESVRPFDDRVEARRALRVRRGGA